MRIANAGEREERHATDEGALVVVVPTVRSEAEAKAAVKWFYYPPMGGRSVAGVQANTPHFWGNVPGAIATPGTTMVF